ncbi:sigma-54-dependent transcriptional regulator [Sandaracinus amylolyticus]|uniref:sigma-54-dependent transcriptional regulator n=1 Tax=Sandaracinus amylolyticus TaxID=927083 RepID=UPI001F3A8F4B|nr:sigma-54 dependent transcriptional regulator [Sandaracinus amylolyticus]UJR81887.1 Transcriptional regulator containing GAF, AAA-type ATPase, and DNA-binding Fis domains [Sandaracinus amylolyticus]
MRCSLGTLAHVLRSDDHESPFARDDDDDAARPAPGARTDGAWKIAIVDDEQEVHDVTVLALRSVSFSDRRLEFLSARSADEARSLLADHPDLALVLLDVVMETDDAGLELVRHIREALGNRNVRVVLRTGQPGQAPESTVIRDFDISDYRTKTELTSTRLLTTVIAALRTYQQLLEVTAQREELARAYAAQSAALEEIAQLKRRLERERDYLREEVSEAGGGAEIIAASATLQKILSEVDAVAATDATVLVLGESGVGKELVARAIHARSERASGPLVKVNCASVPREIFESEFFGHVKGAYTGAHKDRVGRFQLADGGTLFLDEVGEIPLELQSKLLRALQEREVERVGDTRAQRVDVRVVAATNRDLKACVEAGTFRADLYYRLHVFPITVPPLRARRADIAPLFEHFVAKACARLRRPFVPPSPALLRAIEVYPWPGNVRELENVVERAVILAVDGVLRLDTILPDTASSAADDVLAEPSRSSAVPSEPRGASRWPTRGFYTADELRDLERENLLAVMNAADGKVAGPGGAADLLGVKPSTLSYQLKSFGITRR